MTLGKYIKNPDGTVSWESYNSMAESTGDSCFDMGSKWNEVQSKYGFTNSEMFDLFNKPALDYTVTTGKTIRFTHNPADPMYRGSSLKEEWLYLKNVYRYTDLKPMDGYWYAVK